MAKIVDGNLLLKALFREIGNAVEKGFMEICDSDFHKMENLGFAILEGMVPTVKESLVAEQLHLLQQLVDKCDPKTGDDIFCKDTYGHTDFLRYVAEIKGNFYFSPEDQEKIFNKTEEGGSMTHADEIKIITPVKKVEHNRSDTSIYDANGLVLCTFNLEDRFYVTEENQDECEKQQSILIDSIVNLINGSQL